MKPWPGSKYRCTDKILFFTWYCKD